MLNACLVLKTYQTEFWVTVRSSVSIPGDLDGNSELGLICFQRIMDAIAEGQLCYYAMVTS